MLPTLDYLLPPATFQTLTFLVFAFGCCVGSYLNVVIYRLPLGMKTSEPRRSFCPSCKYQIPMWWNVPLVSWLLLRGKCRNCAQPISSRYFFVELMTGVFFTAAFVHLGTEAHWQGFDWTVLAAWIFIALCVAGSFIDIDHQILPHQITWGGAVAGLVCAAVIPGLIVADASRWVNLAHSAGGAVLGFALIWGIVQLGKLAFGRLKYDFEKPEPWSVTQEPGAEEPVFKVADKQEGYSNIFSRPSDRLMIRCASAQLGERALENVTLLLTNETVTIRPAEGGAEETLPLEGIASMSGTCTAVEQPREAMGMGDADWMACVGAFMGWKAVLFTILAGSCIGALLSVLMILLRRREWAARIPFGPYLAAGALIWLFAGPQILAWYLGLSQQQPEGL